MDNNVILLGHYGGDESHSLSAWQSTNIELDIDLSNDISERINQLFQETVKHKKKSACELLAMLAKSGHETPFEKSCLHFQITADIATHIHCIKHRVATSCNSESARYKELKDKWYLPKDWENTSVIHNESEGKLPEAWLWDNEIFTWDEALDLYNELGHGLYHLACEQLTKHLGRKRAKESARYFLPYSKQLDFDMMFNFRSFVHFQRLRNSEHAQKEVKEIAQKMLELVKQIDSFKYSLEAFNLLCH